MKFLCDSCGTKYSISDERVRGRVLKIRCKKCDFVITVREDVAAAAAAVELIAPEPRPAAGFAAALGGGKKAEGAQPPDEEQTMIGGLPADELVAIRAPSPAPKEADDWFLSFDGEQEGPFSLDKARTRVRSESRSGKEAHAWRPGFLVWLPVEEVPELAALGTAHAAPGKPVPVLATTPTPIATTRAPAIPAAAIAKDQRGPRAALSVSAGVQANKAIASESNIATRQVQQLSATPAAKPAIESAASVSAMFNQGFASGDSDPIDLRALEPVGLQPNSDNEEGLEEVSKTGHDDAPDLPISNEASGLVNLAHLAAAARGEKPAGPIMVNGHSPRKNAQQASSPINVEQLNSKQLEAMMEPPEVAQNSAPVVVLAGAAAAAPSPVFKYIALAAIPLMLGLGGAVIYLATHRPSAETIIVTEPSRHRDDSPIFMNDPSTPNGTGGDPKRAGKRPVATGAPAQPKNTAPVAAKGEGNNAQKSLADLYKEDGDKATPRAIGAASRGEQTGGQVSQAAIMAVVTSNKRQLNLCLDRALKHDSTLKSGRVPIQVNVGMSGRVTNVTIPEQQYASSELGQCFVAAVKRWSFPSSDAAYATEFPFILQGQ